MWLKTKEEIEELVDDILSQTELTDRSNQVDEGSSDERDRN
ncbi:MAG: hypothetical protein ABF586_01275 [Sporolactobacillus sp.]